VVDLRPELAPDRLLVIFDGTCGFCSACAGVVQRLDRSGRVAWQPAQAEGLADLVKLTADELGGASWAIAPDGRMVAGAGAIAAALDAALGSGGVLARLVAGPLRGPASAVYSWVATNRTHFPGRAYLDDHGAELTGGTALEIERRMSTAAIGAGAQTSGSDPERAGDPPVGEWTGR
jgi:predicted DCC family thiol-disulfide oxidoreductase YuxK